METLVLPFTVKPVSAAEVARRRVIKRQIKEAERNMPIAPPGTEPKEGELPFVCEEGKSCQRFQVSMTESKKQCMELEPKIEGQYEFCSTKTSDIKKLKYGQIPKYDPATSTGAFDGRLIPHAHSMCGKYIRRNDDHKVYDGKTFKKTMNDTDWKDREILVSADKVKGGDGSSVPL